MRMKDITQRLSFFLAASLLLGAGTVSSENPLRSLRFMMTLAASAQENIPAHSDEIRSFQVRYKKHGRQLMLDIHNQENNSDKITLLDGSTLTTTYIVGGNYYFRTGDGPWRRVDSARFPRPSAEPSESAKVTARLHTTGTGVALPDQRHKGAIIGGFQLAKPELSVDVKSSASQPAVTRCLYVKATGRLRSCGSSDFIMTFDHYNDPGNIVRVPKAALTAPEAFRSAR